MYRKQNCDNRDAGIIEYLDSLYGYAMILTLNGSVAEELVQETYVRALKVLRLFKRDSHIKSWLLTILRNIWLNQPRIRRGTPMRVDCKQVREAILQLPDDGREVIFLREFEDLSYQEIAGVLDCPIDTVLSRLRMARSTLRDQFALGKQLTGALQIPEP